jgi:hypothetical protein
MVDGVIQNRIDDTKSIIELTKALHQTNLDVNSEDLSSENKRSLNEESEGEENSPEKETSKKFRSEDKDSSLNKRFRDNGEGPSGTK